MASDLEGFVAHLESTPADQQIVSRAATPEQITALAAQLGFTVTVQELRQVSRELCAPWWPWSEKGHAWRRSFFRC